MTRKLMTVIAAGLMVLSLSFSAFAGYWVESADGAMYVKDNYGTHYTNCWQWIDGDNDGIAECYCFDAGGKLYVDCTTPDGYKVDEMGRWTVDGEVQIKQVEIVVPETYPHAEMTFHK